ncbi:Major facilitator superfamily multidrug transporter mfsB [Paramyrothecium foliicola]|nr:Major facilitator superfamily multidrug transporter mfsB [Paramyrothecium foliicola]
MPQPQVKDPNAFPWRQLTVLALCRFSEPIAFNSIIAYSFAMMEDLGAGKAEASYYSGLLVSAYAVAEAITALFWGTLSDRYGRKPIVLGGLGGVAISCLMLGFAKTFWVALLARFIGGLLNGNVSVMQTMVAEIVTNPEHEPAAYATQPFVWTLGGILGSVMGGFLAKPADFYPHLFAKDGIFGRYPYLLPNLASVFFIILAIAQGMIFLEETNPRVKSAQGAHDFAIDDEDDETTPLQRDRRKPSRASQISISESTRPLFAEDSLPVPVGGTFDLRRGSFGTMHSIEVHRERRLPIPRTQPDSDSDSDSGVYTGRVWNRTVVMLIVALVIVAYHQMAFGALLPIHLLDEPARPHGQLDFYGGLGYSLHDVSIYLTVNGFVSLVIQAFIFPILVGKLGVWHTFVTTVILYPTTYLLMPFLSAVPKFTSAGIYISMILQAFYGIMVVPTALILLKDATPSTTLLGRVNGMAMSGCCLARTLSPPIVGFIYGTGGSAAAWFSCAGFALIGAIQLIWVPRKHVHEVTVETAIVGRTISHTEGPPSERG